MADEKFNSPQEAFEAAKQAKDVASQRIVDAQKSSFKTQDRDSQIKTLWEIHRRLRLIEEVAGNDTYYNGLTSTDQDSLNDIDLEAGQLRLALKEIAGAVGVSEDEYKSFSPSEETKEEPEEEKKETQTEVEKAIELVRKEFDEAREEVDAVLDIRSTPAEVEEQIMTRFKTLKVSLLRISRTATDQKELDLITALSDEIGAHIDALRKGFPEKAKLSELDLKSWDQKDHPPGAIKFKNIYQDFDTKLANPTYDASDSDIQELETAISVFEGDVLNSQSPLYAQHTNQVEIVGYLRRFYLTRKNPDGVIRGQDVLDKMKDRRREKSDSKDSQDIKTELGLVLPTSLADTEKRLRGLQQLLQKEQARVKGLTNEAQTHYQDIIDRGQDRLQQLASEYYKFYIAETDITKSPRKEIAAVEDAVAKAASVTDANQLSNQLDNLEKAWDALKNLLLPELNEGGQTIFPLAAQVDSFSDRKKNAFEKQIEPQQKRLERFAKEDETSDEGVKRRSVESFFQERFVPLRNEAAIRAFYAERKLVPPNPDLVSFETYLDAVFIAVSEIATSTVWNKKYDQSTDPYTPLQGDSPAHGPLKEVSLLGHPQSYNQADKNRVKDLGALWDQFPALFRDPAERVEAGKFAERQKLLLTEITTWHNRGAVFKKHADKMGPDGALKAWSEIRQRRLVPDLKGAFNRKEMTEAEIKFSQAAEFCMGVWSALSLKPYEIDAMKPHMSPSVRKFIDNPRNKNLIPPYNTTKTEALRLVEEMISEAQVTFGLSQKQAELAYHFGESFRVGSGIEIQLDARYDIANDKVSVSAQEGAPKAMNIGLYVQSAISTEARPDFNPVFKDQMVHGYPPFSRTLQYTHAFKDGGADVDISGWGDMRASIAEILAVEGAIETVKWESASTDADKVVLDSATQTTTAIWPRASVSKSLKPENSFFMDVTHIPMTTTQPLNREDELQRLRTYFGYVTTRGLGFIKALQDRNPFSMPVDDYEVLGFDSDSVPLSGQRLQALKELYKNFRDYWLNAYKVDVQEYPYDMVRMMRFMFSRDDREDENYYVNEKIQEIIEGARDLKDPTDPAKVTTLTPEKWVKDVLTPQIQGYITFDLLMRSVFFLLQPDWRNVAAHYDLEDPDDIAHAYEELSFQTFEEFEVTTKGGQTLINVAKLMYVINQAILLRNAFPEEEEKLLNSGYRLYGNNPQNKIFNRDDLLSLAGEFNLGEGYHYELVDGGKDKKFWQLQRNDGATPTQQYLSDRIILLMQLFHKEGLSGKH